MPINRIGDVAGGDESFVMGPPRLLMCGPRWTLVSFAGTDNARRGPGCTRNPNLVLGTLNLRCFLSKRGTKKVVVPVPLPQRKGLG